MFSNCCLYVVFFSTQTNAYIFYFKGCQIQHHVAPLQEMLTGLYSLFRWTKITHRYRSFQCIFLSSIGLSHAVYLLLLLQGLYTILPKK